MNSDIYGLRTVGEYKLYQKGTAYFVSHKNIKRLRRLQLSCERVASVLKSLPKSDFAQKAELLLNDGKRNGSVNYYEVKHG